VLDSLSHLSELSREWSINEEDILFIALNYCGLDSTLDKEAYSKPIFDQGCEGCQCRSGHLRADHVRGFE
jgi:hypothetical protein